MARILLGWELGGHRGHAVNLTRQRAALAAAGHEVVVAAPTVDALDGRDGLIVQAPVWPRLLAGAALGGAPPVQTLGDILVMMGLDRPGALVGLIRAWDFLIAATRAELVVADYAPALLTAARGRLPTLALGRGFDLPPAHMASFPSLTGLPAAHDEARLLEVVNAELGQVGRAALAGLPGLFAADRAIVGALAELDPYAADRAGPLGDATLAEPLPPPASETGTEIFVYWPASGRDATALWNGVARVGRPVRVYAPGLAGDTAAALERAGFLLMPEPASFSDIVLRSRAIVSHGGFGTTAMALMAGLPHLVVATDLEKALHGRAVDAAGAGAALPLPRADAERVATLLRDIAETPERRARARGCRERILTRIEPRALGPAAAVEAVAELLA